MNAQENTAADLSEVAYVVRISVGGLNPNYPNTETEATQAMEFLNRCLSEMPKGRIIGKEMGVGVFQFGEHQITTQKITYHVGFKRQPHWLIEEAKNRKPWLKVGSK